MSNAFCGTAHGLLLQLDHIHLCACVVLCCIQKTKEAAKGNGTCGMFGASSDDVDLRCRGVQSALPSHCPLAAQLLAIYQPHFSGARIITYPPSYSTYMLCRFTRHLSTFRICLTSSPQLPFDTQFSAIHLPQPPELSLAVPSACLNLWLSNCMSSRH